MNDMPPQTSHDFDFLFGPWIVHHHRLNSRLVGDTRWTDFSGTATARPIFGGLGNMDENVLEFPEGRYEAATLRLFDGVNNLWSIWWLDARRGGFDTPMCGNFKDGIGTFFGDVVHNGTAARVRFIWSETDTETPKWEQAFSIDDGVTWETNWQMRFERNAMNERT